MANPADEDAKYRYLIDQLVKKCGGQGQIEPRKVLAGVWNRNPPERVPKEQQKINDLLGRLASPDRETVAVMLADAFRGGVFNALVVLYEEGVPPFDKGYEGNPFNDFIGRASGDWDWPVGRERFTWGLLTPLRDRRVRRGDGRPANNQRRCSSGAPPEQRWAGGRPCTRRSQRARELASLP